MKTREELIEAMELTLVDNIRPDCTNIIDSSDIAERMFDTLLKEIPCHKEGYMSQNSLWLQKLKAMERKSTPSIAQP